MRGSDDRPGSPRAEQERRASDAGGRGARPAHLTVRVERPEPYPFLAVGWGNLVFVVALAALALALYVRRPEEPATTPLLLVAAGLLGSTLTVVAGLPALALATGGPVLWLSHLSVVGVYSVAWGALLAFSLVFPRDHPWLRRRRTRLALAYAAPLAAMTVWRKGSTTGTHSGRVTALNVTVRYQGGGTVRGMIQTTVCAEPGHSGGPLYDGTRALGLTSGGSGDCRSGGTTFYQPVREAANVYNVIVY